MGQRKADKRPKTGPGTYRRLVMIMAAILPGSIAACTDVNHDLPAAAPTVTTVSGSLTYRERIALPPGSIAKVTLIDASLADGAMPIVAETSILLTSRQVPIPFELTIDRDKFKDKRLYSVRATINARDGSLLWTSDRANPVNPREPSTDLGMLTLVRAMSPGSGLGNRSRRAVFQCADLLVETRFQPDGLELTVSEKIYSLARVRSASGARYARGGSDRIVFWDKGATARLEIDGNIYADCRRIPPVTLLVDREWIVADINGKDVADHPHATMKYDSDGRLSGRSFCNVYSGSYKVSARGVEIGPLAVTRRACLPVLAQRETVFLRLLSTARTFDVTKDTLRLVSTNGEAIKARH